MGRPSKRTREIAKTLVPLKQYGVDEAVATLKNCTAVKFDQSVDLSLNSIAQDFQFPDLVSSHIDDGVTAMVSREARRARTRRR